MVCFEQFFARIPSLSAYYLFSENGSPWGALLCPQCSEDLTVVLADLIRDNVLVEQVLSN
jgi:hypothetical protein